MTSSNARRISKCDFTQFQGAKIDFITRTSCDQQLIIKFTDGTYLVITADTTHLPPAGSIPYMEATITAE
jgi:hypothetical protein